MHKKKLAASILLSISAILLTFALVELFLYFFPIFTFYYILPNGLFENAKSPLDFKIIPNFTGRMVGEYDAEIKINSRGLRDYEHDLSSDKLKILAMGDSMTFGYGVDIDDAFLSVIERKLGVEVIKAGVPAYGQDNQLAYLAAEGVNYNPDIVVIFYYLNDNDDNEGHTDRKVAYGSLIQKYRYERANDWKLYIYAKLYQANTPRLIRSALSNILIFFDKNTKTELIEERMFFKNQTKENNDWLKTAELFKEFKNYLNKSAKLIIIYVPSKKQVYPEKFENFGPDMDIDKPNKVLKDIALSLNINYIDVTRDMRDSNESNMYFKYDPHLTEQGHDLFGTLVSEELRKHMK